MSPKSPSQWKSRQSKSKSDEFLERLRKEGLGPLIDGSNKHSKLPEDATTRFVRVTLLFLSEGFDCTEAVREKFRQLKPVTPIEATAPWNKHQQRLDALTEHLQQGAEALFACYGDSLPTFSEAVSGRLDALQSHRAELAREQAKAAGLSAGRSEELVGRVIAEEQVSMLTIRQWLTFTLANATALWQRHRMTASDKGREKCLLIAVEAFFSATTTFEALGKTLQSCGYSSTRLFDQLELQQLSRTVQSSGGSPIALFQQAMALWQRGSVMASTYQGLLQSPDPRSTTALRVMSALTQGISDEKIASMAAVIDNQNFTVNEKLEKLHALLPTYMQSASAGDLGTLLNVSSAAIKKTTWWKEHRSGKNDDVTGRRQLLHQERKDNVEPEYLKRE